MKFCTLAVVSVLLVATGTPAFAAAGAKFPLKGKAFSASVSSAGSGGGLSVLVPASTIGAGNVFVVQTWCSAGNSGYANLYTGPGGQGEGHWSLISPYTCNGGMCCFTFSPGYVVPEGVDLMTYGSSNNLYSNVTGIITKKAE